MEKEKREKITRVVLHILIWVVFIALPIYSAIRFRMGRNFLVMFYTFTTINAIIFYTNYLLLVPRLFFQKKRYRYYLVLPVLIFCFYFISDFAGKQVSSYISGRENQDQLREEYTDQSERQPGERLGPGQLPPWNMRPPSRSRFIIALPHAQVIGYISSSLFMVFLSLGLRVLERQTKIEKMQGEMEKARLNAELALLKNQISPHFFFNTLNNIYSLIGINPDDSQQAVLKLSKLMRYLLYESEHGNTKLSNEIDFMNNYIDLMKLRMSEKVSLIVDFPEKYDDVSIPPLLFIPFIENSFKHGISFRSGSFIKITLSSTNGTISFKCSNSIADGNQKDVQPGIGLENVRKRLGLLFPGSHSLNIKRGNNEFEVNLEIKVA
jgi:sensor histidine kinase YesM